MANKTKAVTPAEMRVWAREQELEGFGSRGRLNAQKVILPYLKAHPKTAKQVAAELNFALPSRGNAREEALVTLAETIV